MIKGNIILNDSTHIKANTSMGSEIKVLVEKESYAYMDRLDYYEKLERKRSEEKGMKSKRTRKQNETKDFVEKTISKTDPEAWYLKRRRNIHLHVLVDAGEMETIRERMAEAGVQNTGAFVRKMALNGYLLNVDITPAKELVSLLRRCSNNLNQVAIHANTYGVYQSEISVLQKDYAMLWEQTNLVLQQLADVMAV